MKFITKFLYFDIRKVFPGTTKIFKNCLKQRAKIMMDKAYPTKNVFTLCAFNELTPDLTDINRILKNVNKN